MSVIADIVALCTPLLQRQSSCSVCGRRTFTVISLCIKFGGPVITLLGIIIAMVGTYRLTLWYHASDGRGFIIKVIGTARNLSTGHFDSIKSEAMETELQGRPNKESRGDSVVGYYFIFIGFFLQGIGAILWALDSLAGALCPS